MTNDEVLQALAHLIGTAYKPDVKKRITQLTQRTQVIGPDDISSRIFDTSRIHIEVNEKRIITGFRFA